MKKILFSLLFLLISFIGYGQFINTTTTGNPTTLFKSRGGLGADSAFILLNNYADTTAANFSVASKYSGSFIRVDTSIYYRTLNPNKWNLFAKVGSTGTIVSISQGYGIVNTPNPITTVGTITTDTTVIVSKSYFSNFNALNVKYADTASMLNPYLRKIDTLTMLNPYLRKSDTSNMLDPYVRKTRLINTNAPLAGGGSLANNLTLVADTGRANAQLVNGGSLNQVKDSLVALISSSGGGTVLSVATTDGVGIISSVANPTSNANISLRVDTLAISTKANVKKVADSLAGVFTTDSNYIRLQSPITYAQSGSGKVRDTLWAGKLLKSTRIVVDTIQTSGSGGGRILSNSGAVISEFGGGGGDNMDFHGFAGYNANRASSYTAMSFTDKNYVDSSVALRLRISDTSTMLSNYLRKTDTATMLSGYTRVYRFLDTTSVLRALINTKGTGTVTSVGVSLPSIFSVSGSPITTSGTITASLANQNANLVFASPTSGSPATPTFRSLVEADIPNVYVKYTDTSTILSQVVRTFGAQSVDGLKTYNNLAAFNAGIQSFGTIGNAVYAEATTGRALRGVSGVGKGAYMSNNSDTASTVTLENIGTYRIVEFNNSVGVQSYVENNGLVKYSVNKGSLYDDRTLTEKRYVDSAISASVTGGTVTSIATNNGTGITGGTITTTGTLAIDTSSTISTKANVLNQLNKYTGSTNIVTLGTITTGVWNGTAIANANLQNSSITINGNSVSLGGSTTVTATAPNALTIGTDLSGTSYNGSTPVTINNTSTLATVTGRGATTSTAVTFNGGLTSTTGTYSGKLLTTDSIVGVNQRLTGTFNSSVSTNGDFTNIISNISSGTSAFSTMYLSNDGTSAGALAFGAVGTGNTTGGIFPQDGAVIFAGTNLSGGLNIGTRSNSPVRLYTNATLAATFGTDQSLTLTNILKATKIIGNSGSDNGVDAIQSGGGSVLSNLYRAEAKIQATSTTIDATATVWFDNSNGSTVTYTLPNSASLAGGTYRFIKTGTGDLTLSGSIITTAGASVASVTLTSANGMKSYYYNGTNWYQLN